MTAEELIRAFPVQPVPALIEKFFRASAGKSFVDFETLAHSGSLLEGLLPKVIHDKFIVLGRQRSGSLIVLWKESDRPADQLPVAWIDSEGDPVNVFAENFGVFLALLPYDTGFIYDLIKNWEYYLEQGASGDPPSNFYDEGMVKDQLVESRNQNPRFGEYESWLKEDAGLAIAADPVQAVGDAIRNHPGLKDLVKKNK